MTDTRIFFSDVFGVARSTLDSYGAFDINLVSDMPLFVDPFLLFNSQKLAYQQLHEEIIEYLRYLKALSERGTLGPSTIRDLYRFQEVHQNWFGYTFMGNRGHGLGKEFATELHESLANILSNFGLEGTTKGSHLEKLTLIKPGVGKDSISDFATNLIKHFLLDYTEAFARANIEPALCATFGVARARFNFQTQTWATEQRYLPRFQSDFVLLTPVDILTHDDTWINYADMVHRYPEIVAAVDDGIARDRVSRYFESQLSPTADAKERRAAAGDTLRNFPWLLDEYIRGRELNGDTAVSLSTEQRKDLSDVFVVNLSQLIDELLTRTDIAAIAGNSYGKALERVRLFKHYIEHQDGYRLINREKKYSSEKDVQLFFGLALEATRFDVNREPNNGRGPVDFKLSDGANDKSLIEIKLAKSTSFERNLDRQVDIYKTANRTDKAVVMIIVYTEKELAKASRVLKRLELENEESVIVVDARADNKPTGSKA